MSGLCECGCGAAAPLAGRTDPRFGWVKGEPKRFINGHNRRRGGPDYAVCDGPLDTPCWVWQRSLNNKGYGYVGRGGRQTTAHKHYYEERFGKIPDGLEIDHLCRDHACVNPAHMEAVTRAVNAQRGKNAKVTETMVRQIRASPKSARKLGEMFGISHTAAADIKAGRSWRNVV